ncbi:MAG: phosphoglucosamine mutase [Endomicrobium sp.]|jgi:phosphoglucosamine mutase|nr:phosphoglucosamine mutase [Endomicrobium sp.]
MKLFGTDGIRGDSLKYPFDNKTLFYIGKASGEILGSGKKILIIRDTRESGKRIQKALSKGFAAAGCEIVLGGVLPTPSASFLVKKLKFGAAVVISASHNPFGDNGIKIFSGSGLKLTDKTESKIENKINSYLNNLPHATKCLSFGVSKACGLSASNLLSIYEDFIIKQFGKHSLKGKKIVLDCANGAAYKCAPEVLRKLGAHVIALNVKPDGKNINAGCGALHPQNASKTVKELKAFCGFCFDGDADRLICIDENGQIKDGDYFLSSMAVHLKKTGKLKNNILVTTVMANIGLMLSMKKAKIKVITSKVGDRYVLEDLKKYKASLGGEQSGHFIFRDILPTGDGLLSAVTLLSSLAKTGLSMSEFFAGLKKFPQILLNAKVAKKIPFEKLIKTQKLIKAYEKRFGKSSRILARYSGTENLLRVMIEGKDKKEIAKAASEILNTAAREIEEKSKI